jgi:hypothetical protein
MHEGNADLGRRDSGTFARLQNISHCFRFYVFDTFEHHTGKPSVFTSRIAEQKQEFLFW